MRSVATGVLRAGTLGLALTAAAAVMCAGPTEIIVDVYTDAKCEAGARAGLVTGRHTSTLGEGALSSVSERCAAEPARMGRVVLRPPEGDRNAPIAFQLVMRPDGSEPELCTAKAGYAGCIVARRQLRFTKGESLELAVHLRAACLDVPCGEGETCVRGACFDANVPVDCREPCDETALDRAGSGAPTPDGRDGGGDASSPDGAASSSDGGLEASLDAAVGPTLVFDGGAVRGLSAAPDSNKLYWVVGLADESYEVWSGTRPLLADAQRIGGAGAKGTPIAASSDGGRPFVTMPSGPDWLASNGPISTASLPFVVTGLAMGADAMLALGAGGLRRLPLDAATAGYVLGPTPELPGYLKHAAGYAYAATKAGVERRDLLDGGRTVLLQGLALGVAVTPDGGVYCGSFKSPDASAAERIECQRGALRDNFGWTQAQDLELVEENGPGAGPALYIASEAGIHRLALSP